MTENFIIRLSPRWVQKKTLPSINLHGFFNGSLGLGLTYKHMQWKYGMTNNVLLFRPYMFIGLCLFYCSLGSTLQTYSAVPSESDFRPTKKTTTITYNQV